MPEAAPKVDAFVSYSRRDAALAADVVEAAHRRGRTFWLDTADLRPGTAWPDELMRALESADAVVCLLSAAWLGSAECEREYDTGHRLGKRVIPVLLEDLGYDDLPAAMRSVQWIDSRGLSADAVAEQILAAIDLDIERVREHTVWLGRALRWDGSGRERSQLARGRELRQAERFLAQGGTEPAAVPIQSEYVAASRAAERGRQRLLLGSVTSALVLAVALSLVSLHLRGVAVHQKAVADRERDHAVARSLVDQSRDLAVTDPVTARLAALAAFRIDPDDETRAAVVQAAADPTLRLFDTTSSLVFAAAISPDGHTVATGDADGVVRLWNLGTGRSVGRPLVGRGEAVRALAWSPDGRLVAAGGDDGEARVWDAASGTLAAGPFSGGPDLQDGRGSLVWGVAFSPDGRRLATADTDGDLTEFDLATERSLEPHLLAEKEPLTAVLYSADGRTLIAAGDDDRVEFVDTTTRRVEGPRIAFGGGANPVLALTHEGGVLAVGQGDGIVTFWRMSDRTKVTQLTASTQAIHSLAFSADDDLLATSSDQSLVQVWDTHTLRSWGPPLTTPSGQVWGLSFSPKGRELVTAEADGVARLWDLSVDAARGRSLAPGDGQVEAVATTPDSGMVVVGGSGPAVTVWDAKTQQRVGTLPLGSAGTVSTVAVSPDGRYVAAGTLAGDLYLWDLGSRALVAQAVLPLAGAIREVAFTPDGARIVTAEGDNLDTIGTGNGDKSVRQWLVPDLRQHGPELSLPGGFHSMALTSDGRDVVTTAGGDLEVTALATLTRQARQEVGLGLDPLAVSPDGRWVAVGTAKGIQLYRARDLQPTGSPLTGLTQAASALSFSPDSRTLVSGDVAHRIDLWDVATHALLGQTLVGHAASVVDLAFAPDGDYLASAGDTTARMWSTAFLNQPASQLCDQTGRSLTHAEWTRLVGSGVPYREVCSRS